MDKFLGPAREEFIRSRGFIRGAETQASKAVEKLDEELKALSPFIEWLSSKYPDSQPPMLQLLTMFPALRRYRPEVPGGGEVEPPPPPPPPDPDPEIVLPPTGSIVTSVNHGTGVITATPTFASQTGTTITAATLGLYTEAGTLLEQDTTLTSGLAVVFGSRANGTYEVRLLVTQSDAQTKSAVTSVVIDDTAPTGLVVFASDDPNRFLMEPLTELGDGETVTAFQPYPFFDKQHAEHVRLTMDSWPSKNPRRMLWGYISCANNSTTVTGIDTEFLTDLEVGSWISIANNGGAWWEPYKVSAIASDTSLTILTPHRGESISFGIIAPLPFGTVSITNGGSTVTGVGTKFLTDIDPNDVWGAQGADANWRVGYKIVSIASDTSMTITPAWAFPSVTGANHAIDRALTTGPNVNGIAPAQYIRQYGNYYDAVFLAAVLAKRSGLQEDVDRFVKGAQVWYEGPGHHSGYNFGNYPPRESAMLGLMAYAIHRDQNGEEGAHNMWGYLFNAIWGTNGQNGYSSWLNSTNINPVTSPGVYSARDQGYVFGMIAFLARILPDTFLDRDGVTEVTDGAAKRETLRDLAVYIAWQFWAYHQFEDGSWRWGDAFAPDWGTHSIPWHVGLMLEGLIEAHRIAVEDAEYQVPGTGLNGLSAEETIRNSLIKAADWLYPMNFHERSPLTGQAWKWGSSFYTAYSPVHYSYTSMLGAANVPAGNGGDVIVTNANVSPSFEGSPFDFPAHPIGFYRYFSGTVAMAGGGNFASGGGVTNASTTVTRNNANWTLANVGGEIKLGYQVPMGPVSITQGTRALTGTGFLAKLTAGKQYQIPFGGDDITVTVVSIQSDTQATLQADWPKVSVVNGQMHGHWWDTIAAVTSLSSLQTTRPWPFGTSSSVLIQWWGSASVVGIGTTFLTDYFPGKLFWYFDQYGQPRCVRISSIESNTQLTLRYSGYVSATSGAKHGRVEGSFLSGLIDVTTGSVNIVGTNTRFTTELSPGATFWYVAELTGAYQEQPYSFKWYQLTVNTIASDTAMTVTVAPTRTQTACEFAKEQGAFTYVRNVDSGTQMTVGPYTGPALIAAPIRGTFSAVSTFGGDTNEVRDARQLNVEWLHLYGYVYKITGQVKYKTMLDNTLWYCYGVGLPGNDNFGFQYTKNHWYFGWHCQNGAQAYRSSFRALGWRIGG